MAYPPPGEFFRYRQAQYWTRQKTARLRQLLDAHIMKRSRSSYSLSDYAAKRRATGYAVKVAPARKFTAKIVPGFTRRVGNYGRYGVNARSVGALPEKKYFDTALAFLLDTTGEVPATGQLTLIPQGDTENTRDGRKANIESIQIRGNMRFVAAATAAAVTGHMYLVLDTQCNGAAAGVTDVFSSADLSVAMLNLNNSGRFRILKSWDFEQASSAGVATAFGERIKVIKFFKRCNIPVDWSSTTGAITEIRSNNLFLVAGSANGDDAISFTGTCRLRFRG